MSMLSTLGIIGSRAMGLFGTAGSFLSEITSKYLLFAVGALLLTTVALGATAKHYYTRAVEVTATMNGLHELYAENIAQKDLTIETLQKATDNAYLALARQTKVATDLQRQNRRMRSKINELKITDPDVEAYLRTPVPDALYRQLYPESQDGNPANEDGGGDRFVDPAGT